MGEVGVQPRSYCFFQGVVNFLSLGPVLTHNPICYLLEHLVGPSSVDLRHHLHDFVVRVFDLLQLETVLRCDHLERPVD